jgi:hypothetical protein
MIDDESLHVHVSNKTITEDGDCKFYTLPGNERIVVGEAAQKITSLESHQWTQTIFNNFDFKRFVVSFNDLICRLIILESIVQSQYRGEDIPYPPFVRSLQTTKDREVNSQIPITSTKKQKKTSHVAPLEAPNVVDGLAASLLTKCQIYGKCGALLVSIEENHILEGETLRAYEGCVLPLLNLQSTSAIDYKSVLAKLKGRRINPLFL